MRSEGKPGYGFEGFAPPSARPALGAAGYGSDPYNDPYNVRGATGAGAPMPSAAAGPAVAPPLPARIAPATPSPSAAFARYFQDVRARIGLPVEDLARRLNADPLIVYALEAGAVGSLPPWPDVERVVTAYMTALRLDPNPALKAIAAGIAEHHVAGRARPALAAPAGMPAAGAQSFAAAAPFAQLPPAEAAVAAAPEAGPAKSANGVTARLTGMFRRGRNAAEDDQYEHDEREAIPGLKGLMRKAAMIAVMASVGLGAVVAAQASLGKSRLNGPAAEFMRSATDSMVMIFAPKREGLRWIEVNDPRSRRGDKLQTARR